METATYQFSSSGCEEREKIGEHPSDHYLTALATPASSKPRLVHCSSGLSIILPLKQRNNICRVCPVYLWGPASNDEPFLNPPVPVQWRVESS
jgi:hypothetical protein